MLWLIAKIFDIRSDSFLHLLCACRLWLVGKIFDLKTHTFLNFLRASNLCLVSKLFDTKCDCDVLFCRRLTTVETSLSCSYSPNDWGEFFLISWPILLTPSDCFLHLLLASMLWLLAKWYDIGSDSFLHLRTRITAMIGCPITWY